MTLMRQTFARPITLTLIGISTLIRLIPHPANFTPLGATALFGGARLNRPWNYIVPIFILYVTDLFLGFHATMPYVYGSFILVVFLGEKLLSDQPKVWRIACLGVLSSTLFFLITNFGVWQAGGLYPHTFAGLMESYLMGLPFWRNMLAADIVFTVSFFAIEAWAINNVQVQQLESKVVNLVNN